MVQPTVMWVARHLILVALGARAQISVMAPEWLVGSFRETSGKIEGSTATFGAPFYGDRVLGKLFYGESSHSGSHCTEDDYTVPKPARATRMGSDYKEVRLINIFLVRRGKCSFATKVRVAYQKGAHAVIIVDREDSTLTVRNMRNIIVADDGTGHQIKIPSVLVTKGDGGKLIRAARRSRVIVELAWNMPTDRIVRMDQWMSSASTSGMQFLKEFVSKRRTLNQVLVFQPHYAVFSLGSPDPSVAGALCYDDAGRYCAEDPDGAGPITGRDVLMEDLRQLCIHEQYKVQRMSSHVVANNAEVEFATEWWDYVERFADRCRLDGTWASRKFGRQCSERVMRDVGIDAERVDDCVKNTGEAKLKDQWEQSAWSPRALRINGWRYSGVLDADLVTRAVCSGFIQQPQECQALVRPRDPSAPFAPAQQGVSFFTLLAWLFGTLLVGTVCLLLYRRSWKKQLRATLRKEVMDEVRQQMDLYCRL